jgi:hypothetical protein
MALSVPHPPYGLNLALSAFCRFGDAKTEFSSVEFELLEA